MSLTNLLAVAFILLVFIVILIIAAINQIQMAGIKIKDFWSFIEANDSLDKLYVFAQKYNKMSPEEQVIYLAEAEKMFDAFDKIPSVVWEDENDKYSKVLDTYKDIRIMRWNESQKLSTNVKRNKNVKLQDINGEYGKKRNLKKTSN
jgi:hypothetical protein